MCEIEREEERDVYFSEISAWSNGVPQLFYSYESFFGELGLPAKVPNPSTKYQKPDQKKKKKPPYQAGAESRLAQG